MIVFSQQKIGFSRFFPMTIAWYFSGFLLIPFSSYHLLILARPLFMASSILLGSSAFSNKDECLIVYDKSFINILNKSGPKIGPCRTPLDLDCHVCGQVWLFVFDQINSSLLNSLFCRRLHILAIFKLRLKVRLNCVIMCQTLSRDPWRQFQFLCGCEGLVSIVRLNWVWLFRIRDTFCKRIHTYGKFLRNKGSFLDTQVFQKLWTVMVKLSVACNSLFRDCNLSYELI